MFRVRLLQPEVDYDTGRVIARHEIIEGNYREFYDVADKDKDFDISVRRHRAKRSLDANSYYHVLLNKIASRIGASMQEVKNMTLARYGQLEYDANGKTINMIVPDEIDVNKWSEMHLVATAQAKELNGVVYRVYKLLKGSHELDSREMCELIRGTISEAREIGLPEAEIMTPNERELIEKTYGVQL